MAMTPAKRQRERSRQERQREKEIKKQARKAESAEKATRPTVEGEDPDIAGIIPGPQPVPEEDEG